MIPALPRLAARRASLGLLSSAALALTLVASPALRAQQIAAAPPPAQAAPIVEKYALPSGLRVILREDHSSPRVAIDIAYHVGTKDDPAGRRGMAQLFELFLTSPSTRHLEKRARADLLSTLGAYTMPVEINAGLDFTHVLCTAPAHQLELLLWLESDRMGFLLDGVNDAALKEARGRIDDDLRARSDKQYEHVVARAREALFGAKHPYGITFQGDSTELAAVTVDEVRARFRSHYSAANATLAIAGDIAPARVKALVATYFGPIPGAPAPQQAQAPEITLTGEKRIAMEANVDRPVVLAMWPTPRLFEADDLALDVAARILEERLSARLIDADKVAEHVSAAQSSLQLASFFMLRAFVAKGHTADEALRAADDVLDKLRTTDAAADEVERAYRGIVAANMLRENSLEGRARRLIVFDHYLREPGHLPTHLAGYRAVTPASLRATVNARLPAGRRLVAKLTPSASAPKGGRVVGGPR